MNTCVCCGDIIPEGRQICNFCSDNITGKSISYSIGTSDLLNVSKYPTMVQSKTNTKKIRKISKSKKLYSIIRLR